ncbi:MAG: hypothetical protein A2X67_04920 [Ignavibacteria bacterium GWA2_55_11]|nr:MAG: hypothetical protein A2X67_04920 [Ignavibacteria bacterium GWA2_55_11]OGU45916.1 MAG: hypothetical protein A2X68_00475 [Ignavibacteria bacterium GWC2_56_12]OGU66175.1 MAG: hypothetical protein A3C56_03480 [Ignavibacteria bacterium RIFCSPHIGHO2_02_FULL_56_12]OGU69560.1 MAG: hypothetical protein A3H45_07890 [Ignavibacteria bacterium RIFCSPLOWO2_02_FULL_55_14]OGU71794.1 MAG: hypothetical protein A3G43_07420 [Ignavibacteria bacterium RIFCSPLOWO2_12_FULL_56_21]HAV22760.1 hypothetical protei
MKRFSRTRILRKVLILGLKIKTAAGYETAVTRERFEEENKDSLWLTQRLSHCETLVTLYAV